MPDQSRLLDKEYIPGLYGLKCIAIYLLMADHFWIASGKTRPEYMWSLSDGLVGVFGLFVLAGYLVTRSVLREEREFGRINLKRYFARRALRVIPAYYTYILIMAALYFISNVTVRSMLAGLSYTFNYTPGEHSINIGHIWAYCVEEHFFLVWILWLAFAGKRGRGPFLLVLIILPTVLRYALYAPHITDAWFKYTASHLHCHAAALGAGLALFEGNPRFEKVMKWVIKCYVPVLALAYVLFVSRWVERQYQFFYFWTFKPIAISLALAIVLAAYLRSSENRLTRFLDSFVMRRLGLMYYSMYLWQQPFTFSLFGAHRDALSLGEGVLLTLLCSAVSYFCVEVPFIWRRNKIGQATAELIPQPVVARAAPREEKW